MTNLIKEVRHRGDFTGSGGKPDSAYGAYHNVYYRVLNSSSHSRLQISPLHPSMIPMLLAPIGYQLGQPSRPATSGRFPYETIWILSKLVKNGHQEIVENHRQ